ncbi:hypothetical protein VIBNISO65_1420004 [Vibrio nigripulchritudo SO65]|nr:hypothetical protein VIBNIAM115_650074 [Vibrio nigripulchritudo AM115]CCN39521.1 hypothetical protein VIBNIFTn2_1050028 [Vibrio nigripulchritudo FTn2]CCN75622.1 hypothetical protein VIBNISO65_1420004 [Vibrio nigripulchritudo SO65]
MSVCLILCELQGSQHSAEAIVQAITALIVMECYQWNTSSPVKAGEEVFHGYATGFYHLSRIVDFPKSSRILSTSILMNKPT